MCGAGILYVQITFRCTSSTIELRIRIDQVNMISLIHRNCQANQWNQYRKGLNRFVSTFPSIIHIKLNSISRGTRCQLRHKCAVLICVTHLKWICDGFLRDYELQITNAGMNECQFWLSCGKKWCDFFKLEIWPSKTNQEYPCKCSTELETTFRKFEYLFGFVRTIAKRPNFPIYILLIALEFKYIKFENGIIDKNLKFIYCFLHILPSEFHMRNVCIEIFAYAFLTCPLKKTSLWMH